jgi:AcrR family transcriptional regulator
MQVRRSNPERSDATREALVTAARKLFAEKGYAATGTPEIVAAAKVTRGALYHHFADKAHLFRAVVEQEQAAIAAEIEAAAPPEMDPVGAIVEGGETFLAAMSDPGRRRILLVEAPAVLGPAGAAAIDAAHAGRTLVEGVTVAIEAGALAALPAPALADLLDAMYDRAALAATRANAADYRAAIRAIVAGLAAAPSRPARRSGGRGRAR